MKDSKFFAQWKDIIVRNKTTIALSVSAFLFTIIGLILSLFNIVSVEVKDGADPVLVDGISVFFGGSNQKFNFFLLLIYAIPLIGVLLLATSYYVKKFKGMSSLFLLISAILFFIVPFLVATMGGYKKVEATPYLYITICLFIISSICLFMNDFDKTKFNVGEIAETGILIAISIMLGFIKFSVGFGSINGQLIGLSLIALRCSTTKTFLSCGLIYGLVSCMIDGYYIYTFPLEYLVAFGSLSILSAMRPLIFKENKATIEGFILIFVGLLLSSGIRLLCACIDSYVFYGLEDLIANLAGNSIYIFPTAAISCAVMFILYAKPLFIINRLFPSADNSGKEILNTKEQNIKE